DGKSNVLSGFLPLVYGVNAFVNSSTSTKPTDDKPAPTSFLKELKRSQMPVVTVTTSIGPQPATVLACSEEFGLSGHAPIAQWQYTVSHATNNAGSYDLFVEL